MTDSVDAVPDASVDSQSEDPYNLRDYASNCLPADGGKAPEPKTEEPSIYHDNRMYVSNVPFTFRDGDLAELFGRFGLVINAQVICNERGSKGFGFVTMDCVESCERAREALNGANIYGRLIEVKKATPLTRNHRPKRPPPERPLFRGPVSRFPRWMAPPAASFPQPPQPFPPSQMAQQAALSQYIAENSELIQALTVDLLLRGLGGCGAPQPPQPVMPQFQPLLPPVSPLQQSQPGFPFAVSSLSSPPFDVSHLRDQNRPLSHPRRRSNSHKNPNLNGHLRQMQDHLVDLLNLDGNVMNSKHTTTNAPPPPFNSEQHEPNPFGKRKRASGDRFLPDKPLRF